VAVYKKGRRSCRFNAFDMQMLTRLPCDCTGYVPIAGRFGDAAFAEPDFGMPPPLRLAPGAEDDPKR
jgi:hypothetical protein